MSGATTSSLHRERAPDRAGVELAAARGAVVAVHGRGASAASILTLASELDVSGLHWVAPQASGASWYPASFLAPIAVNEPELSAGIARLDEMVDELTAGGIRTDRVALIGFSQGACLALELAARRPRRYGAVVAFTGGLIGPPGAALERPGSLDGTPVFLGSGDPDPHVPWHRVEETRAVLAAMGARVEARRYAGLPHTVHPDEIEAARALLEEMVDGA